MRTYEKKKRKDRTAATIMLCFCLIALVSVFTIKSNIDKVAEKAKNIPVNKEEPASSTEPDDNAVEEESDNSEETEESESTEANADIPVVDSRNDNSQTSQFLSPMNMSMAKISKSYSMDMVVYNQTLDQYMVHPGIDLESKDKNVLAVADGLISDVYTDDAYGRTIEIVHDNGYTSRYCNLEPDKAVEKGDKVSAGQVIGLIGKTSLYEGADNAHLHFELLQGGNLVDPSRYIDF